MKTARTAQPRPRRGFTIVELILAGVIAAMVLGALTIAMSQIIQSKNISHERLDAHVRADLALRNLRRDLISTLRRDDLFYTRLLIRDEAMDTPLGEVDRDQLLIFNHRLRASREIDYNGEGVEYETAYRIDNDEWGPVLWQRRDALPDQYPSAGGVVTPIAEGVISMSLEVWDGDQWLEDWDSDYDGLPHAIRVTIQASGHLAGESEFEAPIAVLRTIVPLDRTPIPDDVMEDRLQQQIALLNGGEAGDGSLLLNGGGESQEGGGFDDAAGTGASNASSSNSQGGGGSGPLLQNRGEQ